MLERETARHVFIIGSKGIPARYGGFETFVDRLTEMHRDNPHLKYHVACKAETAGEFTRHNAHCFAIPVPSIGSASAVYYDLAALRYCCDYIRENRIPGAVVYVLACRIGPFIGPYAKDLRRLGARLFVNPDGHEWMRAKWNAAIRRYWRFSEKLTVKHADLVVCDSRAIQSYIEDEYRRYAPKTTYLAYGADTARAVCDQSTVEEWYAMHDLRERDYYLVVARFEPENNLATIISEFMRSSTRRDCVVIANVSQNAFYAKLAKDTKFESDRRVKFVGPVYDQQLLRKIREGAYGYVHGHEVGGTNPSLLEALASTGLNLVLDVPFNREVAQEGAQYFTKKRGSLQTLIEAADACYPDLGAKARLQVESRYSWEFIAGQYEELFVQD
jgi:rhamnosyltransferase